MDKISIILPSYNEKGNITRLIVEISRTLEKIAPYEIVVVDDNSPDGTADAVREAFGQDRNIRLAVRKEERGLATAVRKGIELSTGSVIVVMDTDFNHNPGYLPQFLDLISFYSVVVGSRFLYGGGMYSAWRYYASLLYNVFIRFALGIPITDKLSGYFAVRREVLEDIDLDYVFHGYGDYFIRFLMTVVSLKISIIEIPVFYDVRAAGESKTKFLKEFLRYTASVIRTRFSRPANMRKTKP
jgi:dolichol-phosphate mannosyltransferase